MLEHRFEGDVALLLLTGVTSPDYILGRISDGNRRTFTTVALGIKMMSRGTAIQEQADQRARVSSSR